MLLPIIICILKPLFNLPYNNDIYKVKNIMEFCFSDYYACSQRTIPDYLFQASCCLTVGWLIYQARSCNTKSTFSALQLTHIRPIKQLILIRSCHRCLNESTHILSLEPNVILVKIYTVLENDKDCYNGGGESVPGIPGASRTFTYLVRGPWCAKMY